jgi:hypothetical protein
MAARLGAAAPQGLTMVIVVRATSRPAAKVSVSRPETRAHGGQPSHLVLVAGFGASDRDILRGAWGELSHEERLAVAVAFGVAPLAR